MPTASKFPRGFTSLVGLLNRGENPREVGYSIQPVVEISRNYLLETQELVTSGNIGPVNGFNSAGLLVPQGETWWLQALEIRLVAAAGMSGRIALGLRMNSNGGAGSVRCCLSDQLDYVASTTSFLCWKPNPFYLLPGYDLGVEATAVAGGAATANLNVIFSRLRT